MNSWVAKNLFYFPIHDLLGQRVRQYLHQVRSTQYLSLDEINRIRDEKIYNLIHYSYQNIPYYRTLFDSIGIRPQNIKGSNDLQCLPLLTKRIILDNEISLVNPKSKQKLYMRKTSGSTGLTLHFKKEAAALAMNDAIMYRCYDWYGIDIGDKQVRFWGVPVISPAKLREELKDFILNRIRISAFDISENSCLKQYRKIMKFKPAYFYGYTTAIYGFCLFAEKMGLDLNRLNLKAVICTAEKMYPHHRDLFNRIFNCPVVDEYGSSENGIIAFQCREGNMHVMSDHLCVEFLDDRDERVNPGELGKIVITDLGAYEMPLIRYEIGDVGRYSDKQCICGVDLPIMDIVEGRKEDFIRTRDGKLIHAAYLCYTLKDDSVHEFKMYQKELNRFLVQIVKSHQFNDDSEKRLRNNLCSSLGDDVVIEFEYLLRIPREISGKLRYFVSELNRKESDSDHS
jgi:phenylacetate-CoA ligase